MAAACSLAVCCAACRAARSASSRSTVDGRSTVAGASAAVTPLEAMPAMNNSSTPRPRHACRIRRCVNIAVTTVVRAFLVCEGRSSQACLVDLPARRAGYAITSVTGLPAIASGRPPRSCTSDAGSIPISM